MAAPKFNRFALGNNGGRPAKYETPQELETKIFEYFDWVVKENEGRATVTGLALFLGFEDKQSLYDYQKKEEFTCLIKKARSAVENFYEEKLISMSYGGAIFALKNMGWKDEIIEHQNQTITNVTITEKKRES